MERGYQIGVLSDDQKHAETLDMKTAFLHGKLEEEIHMECTNGLEHDEDEILLLKKALYGLVQAARQFYKKWKETLEKIGFEMSQVDPCLFVKGKKIIIGTNVDDNLIIGKDEDVKKTIEDIKKTDMNITVSDVLEDYLSCKIVMNEDNTKGWIGQPHLIKKLMKEFGENVKHLHVFNTPGTPGQRLLKVHEDDELLSSEEQTEYRSGVGMLLFLVKHSRPDIANATRELSKHMGGANRRSRKELFRVIKYVIDTRDLGLKIEPKLEATWDLTMYTDADWAGDKDNRISIGGFVLFLCGVPIMWRSKAQKSVTLSSGESEYVSLSDAAREIKFVIMLLQTMGVKVELPVKVRVDNVSAIFMAETANSTNRTRHVDMRYHFVREYVEEGIIKILFVSTDKNLADMFTKNATKKVYDLHANELVTSCPVKQDELGDESKKADEQEGCWKDDVNRLSS